MKKVILFFLALILVVGAAPAAHAWRDSISSQWPTKAIVIDGRAFEWADWPMDEEDGISIRAMNDPTNLYLLIAGANDGGRVLLSGKYGQMMTLWFLKPDHITKTWGILIDFGHAQPQDTTATPSLDTFGVAPQKLVWDGTRASTTTLPAEIVIKTDLSSVYGRQPVYEMSIPLSMLEAKGRAIYADLSTTDFSADAKVEIEAGISDIHSKGDDHPKAPAAPTPGQPTPPPPSPASSDKKLADVPKPLDLHLTFVLAKKP